MSRKRKKQSIKIPDEARLLLQRFMKRLNRKELFDIAERRDSHKRKRSSKRCD